MFFQLWMERSLSQAIKGSAQTCFACVLLEVGEWGKAL